MAAILAVDVVVSTLGVMANAEEREADRISVADIADIAENNYQPIPYYEEDTQILKGTDDSNNPDLAAMAKEAGYSKDTFNFVNFTVGDYFTYEEFLDFLDYFRNKCSSEEHTHNLQTTCGVLNGGACYGMTALSVLAHNGYIDPNSIQSGAGSLNDISIDADVAKIVLEYALSQTYHEVELASNKGASSRTKESYIDELLEYGEKSNETGEYFLIAYSGRRDDSMIGHAVTGIGMAEGSWTYNDINYDKCILTYDSNCKKKDAENEAGDFTQALCIYVNSATKQFCIPGYGFSTENGSFLDYVIDSPNILNYKGLINGTDDIGEDISDSVKMYFFNTFLKNGLEVTAIKDNGEEYDVIEKIKTQFADGLWGNQFYLFDAHKFHIEQNKGVEYSIEHNGESGYSTDLDGSTWGQYYTTRYSTDDNYNYAIDIEPQKVSVTNKEAAPGYEDKEMVSTCSLSFPDKYYYYFWPTIAENETVSIEEYEDGVLLTSSDGTLKGNMLITSNNKDIKLKGELMSTGTPRQNLEVSMNIEGNAYLKVEDTETVGVYLDPDNDGVYDTPLESGDVDGDGKIDIDDAAEVLKYYAESAAGLSAGQVGLNVTYPLSLNTADINGDKKIDISDAALILEKYAKNAAGIK